MRREAEFFYSVIFLAFEVFQYWDLEWTYRITYPAHLLWQHISELEKADRFDVHESENCPNALKP